MKPLRPGALILITLIYVITAALWPRGGWLGLALLAVLLAGVVAGLGLGWRRLAKEMAKVEVFVLGIAVLAVLQPGGLWIAAELLVKAHLCATAMVVLGCLVPFDLFMDVLRRRGVPDGVLMPLALMDRYRGVLTREWRRLWGARQSRTFATRGWRGKMPVDCLGALLARCLARAERIAGAMMSRGWGR